MHKENETTAMVAVTLISAVMSAVIMISAFSGSASKGSEFVQASMPAHSHLAASAKPSADQASPAPEAPVAPSASVQKTAMAGDAEPGMILSMDHNSRKTEKKSMDS